MTDKHPRDMAHRVVPSAPTRITVSGGPKVEARLSQPDAIDIITKHTHTAAELLLVLSALTLLVVTLIIVVILNQS